MIADNSNILNFSQPDFEFSENQKVEIVKKCMIETITHFKCYLESEFHKKKKLNEDELTQEFTKQIQILIRMKNYPFNVEGQYRDNYKLSKGLSDFFFYPNEQNVELSSFYSVESKRLPSSELRREKEYVIGNKNNGGIERYKTEKHGKGLNKCGLLGFVEAENFDYWNTTINNWITELSETDNSNWKNDERLSLKESNLDFCVLESVAHRTNDDIHLTHIWVSINT